MAGVVSRHRQPTRSGWRDGNGAEVSRRREEDAPPQPLDHSPGWRSARPPTHPSLRERASANPQRKAALAAVARQLVKANEVVLIDAGSTNLQVACALPDGHAAAIITNSPEIAVAIGGMQRTEVVLLGGTMHPGSGWVGGARTLQQLDELRPDLCLLGVCSVDVESGIGASHAEEAVLKQKMAQVSARVGVAVLRERMLSRAAFRVVPLSAVDHLVVEADAPQDLLRKISATEGAPDILIAGAVES